MNLRYVTCSGISESTSIKALTSLAHRYKLMEIAIPVSAASMQQSGKLPFWVNMLLLESAQMPEPINLAIHVNQEWASNICNGKIPYALSEWLQVAHPDTMQPMIRRWQLDISKDIATTIKPNKLAQVIRKFRNLEFVLHVNDDTTAIVNKMYRTGTKFSVLYDTSGNKGNWKAPLYNNCAFGYAGEISPDNVCENLEKLSAIIPHTYYWKNRYGHFSNKIWIDAGKQLQTNDTFDTQLAQQYIKNALNWYHQHIR